MINIERNQCYEGNKVRLLTAGNSMLWTVKIVSCLASVHIPNTTFNFQRHLIHNQPLTLCISCYWQCLAVARFDHLQDNCGLTRISGPVPEFSGLTACHTHVASKLQTLAAEPHT